MRKNKTLTLEYIAPIPDVPIGYTYVSAGVSNKREGLFLFIKNDPKGEVHGRHSKLRMGKSKDFLLVIQDDRAREDIFITDIDFTFPVFDVFPDRRVLIAASRCAWGMGDKYLLNGLIYDPKTGERTLFLAGDGIESLAINSKSHIFISYYDEGVFGNNGWEGQGIEGPGVGGVTCFDDTGEVLWQHNKTANMEDGSFISDCYALNVSGSDAYYYFYTDFLLAKTNSKFETTLWRTSMSGCHCFAISRDAILFSGQYDDDLGNEFYLMRRTPNKLTRQTKIYAKLSKGYMSDPSQTIGRGWNIHYFNKDGWFRGSIYTLLQLFDTE